MNVMERIEPKKAYILFVEALNKRLGVDGKKLIEIAALAADQGKTVDDVVAMVEQDFWIYDGETPRDGYSYVCSAYVTSMWKAAGLFDGMEINATEFSPADVYHLNHFDLTTPRPDACVAADPNLPFCQILGKYRLYTDGYSSVDPYSHMNERCQINWPSYKRDEGC